MSPINTEARYAAESSGILGDRDQVIIGLPPVPADAPAARLTEREGVRYLVQILLVVCAIALGAEVIATVGIRWLAPARLDISGPEDALLLAKGRPQAGPYVLVLGDSVMRDGALRRALGRGAASGTIPQFLRMRAARDLSTASVVDLSMEGALVNDYAGLLQLVIGEGMAPSAVVMQLDYRVLSPVHDDEQNLSRPWLGTYVRMLESAPVAEGAPPETLARPIDEWVGGTLLRSNAFLLLRGGRHAVGRWLADRTESALGVIQHPDAASDTSNEVLKLSVGRFYRTNRSAARSRMLAHLLRTIDEISERKIPVLVVLTPTNVDFLDDQIDLPSYRANIRSVESSISERYGAPAHVQWLSLDGDVPPSMFLDHVHMKPEGNRLVADRIMNRLELMLNDVLN